MDGSCTYILHGNADNTTFKIVSRDLQTGVQHTYKLSGDYSCVSLSPSGTQVSYIAPSGRLIVENLITGTHRVLVQEPSADYTSVPGLPGFPVFGGIDCGAWISEDVLLLHRFTGPFPTNIINSELPPNTTTLALLRQGTLVDTAGASLTIQALSGDAAYVLLAGPTYGNWKLAQVSAFTSFAAARPISCAGIHCGLFGFVPHSHEVYGYQYGLFPGDYKRLVFVDPKSLAAQLGPIGLPANTVITSYRDPAISTQANLAVIQWGGTPDDAIVVYEYQEGLSGNQHYYAATSLRSGEVDWLTDASSSDALIGWFP